MSGGYVGGYADGYRAGVAPVGRPATIRLVAAAVLFLVAALALGGSFGPFYVSTYTYTPAGSSTGGERVTSFSNGWWYSTDNPDPSPGFSPQPPLHGISLTIGALLAVVAAIMLIVTARRAGDPPAPRLVGVGSAAFLLGAVGAIWLGLASGLRNSQVNNDPNSSVQTSYDVGDGAWLLLLVAVVALVVIGLLLAPRGTTPMGTPPTPYGPGYGASPTYPPVGYGGVPGYPPVGYGAAPAYPPGPAGPPGSAPPAGVHPGWAGPPQSWGPPTAEPSAGAGPSEGSPSSGNRPPESEQPDSPPPEGPAGPQPPS